MSVMYKRFFRVGLLLILLILITLPVDTTGSSFDGRTVSIGSLAELNRTYLDGNLIIRIGRQ